jgi:hypothetical protein
VIQSRRPSNVKGLRIGTINVVTSNEAERLEKINKCMEKRKTDMLSSRKIKWRNTGYKF